MSSPTTLTATQRGRLAMLWLAGMDLRVTLLAVPPLLPLIRMELGLDEKGVALLSSLPVLILGIAAVPGSLLVARLGARRVLLMGLTLVGIAAALRGIGSSYPLLLLMTLLMGIGISISQPTMPALVRQWFPTVVTRVTGVWSNGLLSGELIGASLTLALVMPLVGGHWQAALSFWAIPVFLAVGLLAVGTRHVAADASTWRGAGWPDWRQPRTWQLGLLQSSSSLTYFGTNTFMPDFLHTSGQPELVGPVLTAINFAQIPASFVVGMVPWRILSRQGLVVLSGALTFLGLAAIFAASPVVIVAAAALLGFVSAYVLVICFALPALLASDREVARLAAGGSTIGYSVAFTTNLVAGALWDATHQSVFALLPVLLGGTIVVLLGPRLVAGRAARV